MHQHPSQIIQTFLSKNKYQKVNNHPYPLLRPSELNPLLLTSLSSYLLKSPQVTVSTRFSSSFPYLSSSSSRWDFHFHSYVLTIYVCLYWILELVVVYSLVRRGYIRKVSVQLVTKYFSRVCSTDIFSCSKRKNYYRSAVALPLLLRCCAAVAPILYRYRSAVVAPVVATLLHRYRTVIAPLLL